MEKYITQTLDEYYNEETAGKTVQFKMIKMDQPANLHLVENFNLYTASVVLLQIDKAEVTDSRIFRDAWEYSMDEARFKNRLRHDLEALLNIPDE